MDIFDFNAIKIQFKIPFKFEFKIELEIQFEIQFKIQSKIKGRWRHLDATWTPLGRHFNATQTLVNYTTRTARFHPN